MIWVLFVVLLVEGVVGQVAVERVDVVGVVGCWAQTGVAVGKHIDLQGLH